MQVPCTLTTPKPQRHVVGGAVVGGSVGTLGEDRSGTPSLSTSSVLGGGGGAAGVDAGSRASTPRSLVWRTSSTPGRLTRRTIDSMANMNSLTQVGTSSSSSSHKTYFHIDNSDQSVLNSAGLEQVKESSICEPIGHVHVLIKSFFVDRKFISFSTRKRENV